MAVMRDPTENVEDVERGGLFVVLDRWGDEGNVERVDEAEASGEEFAEETRYGCDWV